MRSARGALGVVAVAWCWFSFSFWGAARGDRAPSPPPSPARESRPVVVSPAPSIERLRALLGQSVDGVPAVEALAPLGDAVREAGAVRWPEHGLVATLDAQRRIVEVTLERGYTGELPLGVRLGMRDYELPGSVTRSLLRLRPVPGGKPRTVRYWYGPVTFSNHGLRLEYGADQRVARVSLFAPRAPKTVRFDDVSVHDHQTSGQVGSGLGVLVHFRRSADRRPDDGADGASGAKRGHDCEAERATIELEIDNRAVRLLPEPRNWLGLCGEIDDHLFVPYARIDLPEGVHAGRLRVRRADHAEVSAWVPVELTMPATRLVRLRVGEVVVHPGVFGDRNLAAFFSFGLSSVWKRPKACPDPAWLVMVGGDVLYRSKTVGCKFTARWSETTEWLRVPANEAIAIVIVDEDFAGSEGLGRFSFAPEALGEIVAAKRPLSDRAITKLVLEGEVLDGNAAIPVEPKRAKGPRSAPRGKK